MFQTTNLEFLLAAEMARSFSNCITSHKGASSLAHFNLVKKICPDSLSNLSSELSSWDGHLRELSVSRNCLLNEWWLYLNSKGPFLYLWGCWWGKVFKLKRINMTAHKCDKILKEEQKGHPCAWKNLTPVIKVQKMSASKYFCTQGNQSNGYVQKLFCEKLKYQLIP